MNKYRLLFWAFLTASVGEHATAQQRHLSIKEAITLSLNNNTDLKINEARLQQVKAGLQEARNNRLPDMTISGSYMRLNQPDIDLKIKTGSSSQEGSGSATGNSSATTLRVNELAYGMANISIPVFAGSKINNGVKAAKYQEKAEVLEAEKDKESVITNTIEAYGNVYKARQAVELIRENLKQAEQRVKDFSNLEKNGLLARNDYLKAQLQASNTSLALLDAENNEKLATTILNLQLGLPEATQLDLDELSFMNIPETRSYEEWEKIAMENRKDAQALDYRKKAAEASVQIAKGDYYPSIALTGGYIAGYIPNVLTINNALNAGIGLRYSPSSLWKTNAKVNKAKAGALEAELSQYKLSDAIRLQVAQAYQKNLTAGKKVEVYAKAVEQASENYRIVKNKYANALATTTELLEADVALLQAKLNESYAKADAIIAYENLLKETGIIQTNP